MSEQIPLTEFGELYRKYAPAVYRFALSLCGREAEAEDLVSETFLRVWMTKTPVRAATVRAYLIAIARNLYLEGRRKQWREKALDFDLAGALDVGAEHEARAEWARVRDRMADLPEATRSALVMHSVLEMPYSEIEAVLGVPAAALKVRVHRARITLAERSGRKEMV